MAETPASLGLREMSVEMSEKFGISEVKQAGGGVRHHIGLPRDEGELGAIAVVALVFAGPLAQVGGGAGGGCCSLEHAG